MLCLGQYVSSRLSVVLCDGYLRLFTSLKTPTCDVEHYPNPALIAQLHSEGFRQVGLLPSYDGTTNELYLVKLGLREGLRVQRNDERRAMEQTSEPCRNEERNCKNKGS